jgi:hypothetical protein
MRASRSSSLARLTLKLVFTFAWLWALPLSWPGNARAHNRAARYYVKVRNVIEAPGVKSGFADQAKELLGDELKQHDAFTLEWPADLPSSDDEVALVKALRKRKIRAFEVTLKILDVKRSLDPPPPGKQYRVLKRGIKLSIFGNTLPDKVLAIGGDGESQVAAEVGKQADIDKEGSTLLAEATKEAIRQAVEMTLNKLDLADKPQKLTSKKKKK